MTTEIYCVIQNGYATKDDKGWDEPRMLYAGTNQRVAEIIIENMKQIGIGLNAIGTHWIPIPGPDPDADYFAAPGQTFLVKAAHNYGDDESPADKPWIAIVTDEKNFTIPRDRTGTIDNDEMHVPHPTDFSFCAWREAEKQQRMRFHTADEEHLAIILRAHKCGTPQSDHKVIYFMPDENTARD